jgi:hypothetical protein
MTKRTVATPILAKAAARYWHLRDNAEFELLSCSPSWPANRI